MKDWGQLWSFCQTHLGPRLPTGKPEAVSVRPRQHSQRPWPLQALLGREAAPSQEDAVAAPSPSSPAWLPLTVLLSDSQYQWINT